jgi:alpha-methylacyl-CoA racemase
MRSLPYSAACVAALAVVTSLAAGQGAARPADLIVLNARVTTLDPRRPEATAVAIADGKFVAVGCVEPQFFAELVEKLGLDAGSDESADLPFQLDPTGWDDWRAVIGKAFLSRPRDEWTAHFDGSDACVTPVLSPWEAHRHPHAVARSSFVEVDGVLQPAPAPRFSRTPAGTPEPHSPGTTFDR